jgi:hypothetical protein
MKDKIDRKLVLKTEEILKLNDRLQQLEEELRESTIKAKELEVDNMAYLQKIIQMSKVISDVEGEKKFTPGMKLTDYSSAMVIHSEKKMKQVQVEEMIMEIYENKRRHEEARRSCSSMPMYLPKFFQYKFGIPEMATFNINCFQ